jgi:hypothetical protein
MQRTAAFVLVFLSFGLVSAVAQDPTVTWKEVHGIVVPGSIVGAGTGAVTGGGLPWITSGGVAHVNLATGQVQFVVRGLVLAAGSPIGTRGDINAVFATLVCDTNGSAGGGNSTLVQYCGGSIVAARRRANQWQCRGVASGVQYGARLGLAGSCRSGQWRERERALDRVRRSAEFLNESGARCQLDSAS